MKVMDLKALQFFEASEAVKAKHGETYFREAIYAMKPEGYGKT